MIEQVVNPVLEVHDLTVSYNKKPVLWNVDFTIPKGVLACIVGPNGAGKSTLIKSIMGLAEKSSGYAKVFDFNIDKARRRVSYVPQRESVDWDFPTSIFEVVLMGRYGHLGLFKRPSKKDKEIAFRCLEEVGMQDFYKRQISQLSGGQQQRVFLARALAQEADLYLMDEPFVGIDATTEKSIVDLLKSLKDKGKTVVIVHHDLQSALSYFDWAVLLNTRLVASGPLEKVFTPDLLQNTYGGQLSLLNQIGDLIQKEEYPTRE